MGSDSLFRSGIENHMNETARNRPPQWPIKLLRKVLNQDYLEEIEGDMEEIFLDNLERYSEKEARQLYIKDSFKLIRPQLLRHFEGRQQLNAYGMFKNNLKIAIRVFQRDKVYTLINVLGMATGLAIAMLILLYAQFEMSYESYNPNADRLVRITMDYLDGETLVDQDSETYPPLGPKIKEEFSEVVDYARAYGLDEVTLNVNEKNFRESKIYAADPSFFDMFNYPFIQGSGQGIFQDPMEAVLTESMALKMFGTTDIVGERMLIPDMEQNLNVVGVIPDSPDNTHFKFNILISFETMYNFEEDLDNNWNGNNTFTYLKLNSADQYDIVESNLRALNDQLHELDLIAGEEVIGQKIEDIHLYSDKSFEPEQNGDANQVYFLIGVALLVIFIAIVNYINLSTAKAMDRAKEVGVRKVMGSTVSELRFQFFTESLLVNLIAGALAIAMMILSLGFFRHTADLPESFTFHDLPDFWLLLTSILVISTLVSGVFPALVLSSYKPISVLKGKYVHSRSGTILRKGLVVFQFSITIFLLVQTLAANWQIDFMRTKDIGLNIERTIVVRTPHTDELRGKFTTFKNELLNQSSFKNVAVSNSVPGLPSSQMSTGTGINLVEALEERNFNFYINWIDEHYLETMQMQLLAGKNFIPGSPNENMVIVNEESVRLWGIPSPEEAIGKKLDMWGAQRTIIGVVKNYQQLSAKSSYLPVILNYSDKFDAYASIRTNPGDLKEQLRTVVEVYEANFPNAPFEYFFLDQQFDQLYRADEQFQAVFGLLTGFALLIACLGLFGLASFTVAKRAKEIGIRKVLGAEVAQIMALVSKEFIWLVLIAMAIAIPTAYFMVGNWLDRYAFRMDVNIWLFVIPALGVVFVALLAVFSKTLSVATTNPVSSLRDE